MPRRCDWRPFPSPVASQRALVDGFESIINSTALEVTVGPGRVVSGVRYVRDGVVVELRARAVVLAAGVLENVRLLLLSRSPAFTHGLANGCYQVGRGFMTHAFVHVCGRFPGEDLQRADGTPAQAVAVAELENEGGSIIQAAMALAPQEDPAVGAVWAQPAQATRSGSRLDLDPAHFDPLGRPVLRITHDLDATDRARRALLVPAMERWLRAAGASETWVAVDLDDPQPLSTHQYGGTLMGDDPATSVVDRELRAHEVPNLAVLGSSTFPQTGSRGPTLTLEALAWRAADRLASLLQDPASPL